MSAYRSLRSSQHRRFVDLLVQRTNATEAVRQIRPHLKRPDVLAAKWRALPEIKAALLERETEAMDEAGITSVRILLDIAEISNFNVKTFHKPDGSLKKPHELDDAAARVIEGVEYDKDGNVKRYRLPSRLDSKKLLGLHLNLFTEKLELRPVGPLTVELVRFAEEKPADEAPRS